MAIALGLTLSVTACVPDGARAVASHESPSSSPAASATAPVDVTPSASTPLEAAPVTPTPAASPSRPGSLTLPAKIVFEDERWQMTPLPSWEPETDTVALDSFEATIQAVAEPFDAELVGVWFPGGRADDTVQLIHYSHRTSLANDANAEAILNAHATAYRESGTEVTAADVEWTYPGGFRAATQEMALDTGAAVTYETVTVVQLEDTLAVITSRSPKANRALMGAWGAANSLRHAISW